MDRLKTFIKASPLWPLLRPRRFHAYCVGAAKTGTVAVAAMLAGRYRSAHEPTFHEVIDLVLGVDSGAVDTTELRRRLRERDRSLRLEMESSHAMGQFCAELATEFPAGRFILTVREPRDWLDSIINQHLNVDVSARPREQSLRAHLYGVRGAAQDDNDEVLLGRGLYTLSGYLGAWARQNRTVLDAVPPDRLLVVRTEYLDQSAGEIAAFLGPPTRKVTPGKRNLHTAPQRHGVADSLDPKLLQSRVDDICGEVARRLNERLSRERLLKL